MWLRFNNEKMMKCGPVMGLFMYIWWGPRGIVHARLLIDADRAVHLMLGRQPGNWRRGFFSILFDLIFFFFYKKIIKFLFL